jgi:imidazolonepropionase-like amidohydrolase
MRFFPSAALSSVFLCATAAAAPLAIIHGTIIDGTGRAAIEDGVLVIEKGRIAAVGSASATKIPTGAKLLDKKGKFIIPGLMDSNVHLFINLDVDTLVRQRGHYDDIAVEGAQIALKGGLTTVFDTWGPFADIKSARDRINSGKDVGSRIFFAGNIIGLDGPASDDFMSDLKGVLRKDFIVNLNKRWTQGTGRELQWDTAEEVGKKVAAYAARDEDFLKYASNGHREMAFLAFSQRSQNAIVKAGHDAGKTVQSHVHSLEGIQAALDAGVDILTHCDITPERIIPPEIIREIVAKHVTCSVMPVTKAYQESTVKFIAPFFIKSWQNIKNLVAAGVPVMLSTDAGINDPLPVTAPEKPVVDDRVAIGEGHFNALMALQELGIDPMKALQSATINIAKGYKVDKDFGSLEVGKVADMVILDANPLRSARNYRAINAVIKAGEVVNLAALPAAPQISNRKALPEE